MKKISKEFKAGIAALVILTLFYWGFSYLKGRNLLSGSLNSYYTTYKNVNGLKKSSPVTMNGFAVGSVVDIYFSSDPERQGELIVEFTIEEDVSFSKNSTAKIYSGGLMGGRSLGIVPSFDGETAKPGDYLKGKVEKDMVASITGRLDPLQEKVESAITHIDSITVQMSQMLDGKTIANIQESFSTLNRTLKNLENTTAVVDSGIHSTMQNVNETTQNLKVFSDSLSQVKIVDLSNKLNATIGDLNTITTDIKNGKGTIGLLTQDEELYNNLEAASKELEELLRNVKEHPKRFVHFSLFGKKEKSYQETKEE
ncbi:MlaD family protein [Wenyingzhuangia sp. 2_MG-2023]|uniref:MlaD family protein n=1 Tax=Wenyingzhuangia sp. 2_MG-2023 TaxID=3062639 RepID=UPI0026E213CE|nr:MlaD family protein [Wenyingzhuangia sp. 2_MG-2023]MDO6738018.1 MlaD family protein [Wenyingzhuangia sp. 2_MG-2023]MDO6802628.1 MlaD family protein [Wenyingzhuangia sp. 1_MG-2023]